VSENIVIRRILRLKRDKVTREWRELDNEELSNVYCSPNVNRVTKSKRMRWTGHVTRMENRRGAAGLWWENLREGDHLEDVGIDGKKILKWIL
jgi:hypothetical protein